MFDGHRVVVVTPAGRRRYMDVLMKHLLRQGIVVDEWQLWQNAVDGEDLAWMRRAADQHAGFVRLVPCPIRVDPQHISGSIHSFFPGCTEPGTIYIRCDDDIIWMHKDCITNLCADRLADREPFIMSANVVNNAICTHIHQRIGALSRAAGIATYECMCPTAWNSGPFARAVHEEFLTTAEADDTVRFAYFDSWSIWENTRFSINMICWMGEDMAGVSVPVEEETFLTVDHPRAVGRTTKIVGTALACHYAFFTQRQDVDGDPSILERYRKLAEDTR